MKKTIRRIVSKVLATVTAIATLASPIAPSITVHAEEGNPALPAEYILNADNTTYSVEGSTITVSAFEHDGTNSVITLDKTEYINSVNSKENIMANKVVLSSDFFKCNDEPYMLELTGDVYIDSIKGSNIKEIEFGAGVRLNNNSDFEGLFSGCTNLTSVSGFGNLIWSCSASDITLKDTFAGCTQLTSIDIDVTGATPTINLKNTFDSCSALDSISIRGAKFNTIEQLNENDVCFKNTISIRFSNCTFKDANVVTPIMYTSLYGAFKNVFGTVTFKDCNSETGVGFGLDHAFYGSYDSEAKGNLKIVNDNSNIIYMRELFGMSKYQTLDVTNLVDSKVKAIDELFGTYCEVDEIVGIDTWDVSGIDKIYYPFNGLDAEKEVALKAIKDFLSLDLTHATEYHSIAMAHNVEYDDLSGVELNSSEDTIYYHGTMPHTNYIPEYFVTPEVFGGKYLMTYEAWKVTGEGENEAYSQIVADGNENIKVQAGTTGEGFLYNNDSLEHNTKYTHSKATVKFTDVYTDTTRTTYCAGGTVITSVVGYDEKINYFTDESLKTAFNPEGYIVEEDTVLQLYYTTEEGAGGGSDVPGDNTIDKQLSVTFVNAESSDIPSTLSVSWKAVGGTVSDSGTTSVSIDKTKATQMITVPVPSVVEGITELTYEFTIADVEGFDITKASDGITFTLTKKAATPPVEEEPDYSVICNLPSGWGAEFVGDVTAITATLEDGTTRKLGQDGDVITIGGSVMDTPDAYAQTSDFSLYASKKFIQPTITIKNGENTYNVKSIDGLINYNVYIKLSNFDGERFTVYSYTNGISKSPTQVESNVYYLDTSGNTISMMLNDMSPTVILYDGASYTNSHYIYNVTLNWKDTGYESKRPETVTVSWNAVYYSDKYTMSDVFTVSKDVTKHTQVVSVSIPKTYNLEGSYSLDTVSFEIVDIPNYTITKTPGKYSHFDLTYNPTPLEPIVEDIPEGVSINFGKDIEDITATLADGTTKPLGSDDTSLIVSVDPKAQTVYQSPKNQTFDKILFYDVNLTLTDGNSEWKVKSIDSPMGIAIPLPSDCGSTANIKVWHYDNGIMTEPTEVQNKSVTSAHVVIPTTSYSYYAVSYNVGDTEQKTITINWNDEGHESERPTSVVADWTATYADDSTKEGTAVFNRDNTVDKQTTTINVPKSNSGSSLVSTAANIRAVTGYEVVTTPGDPLTFTLKYVGNTASYVTVTFGVELLNTPTGTKLPNSVPLTVYTWYTDGTKDTYNTTIDIGSTGTGSKAVERPIKNADGSAYLRTTWSWGDVDGYTLTNKTSYAVYEYDGSSTSIQTVYPVTIKFNGDSADKTKRPTSLTVTWTATTNTSNTVSTGTANVNITNASDSFSQNITIPDTTGEQRTVTFTGPVLEGYNMNVNGSTITYTYNVKNATNTSYEIIFDDEDNKSGRRPAELTVTFADTTNSSNTITSKLTIAENTTTKVKTYKGNISIPAGTTYAITKVETLPEGYKASISGLSATLKYTPEKINKTFKIEWKNDVEDVRPSSVTVKVKSGDIEGATLTLKKDTNWAASTDLLKYIKGVEANWTAEASSVTNYSASVSGETITMTYTGTLTEAQKEAINATDKDGSEKEKEQLYDFEKFDWIDYANRYPDVKKAFGYNKEALYAHYIHYGIAEGRIATWTGKYENVNEDILKAYFPNDYKYKVENSSSADQMLEDMGGGSSNSTNSSDKSNVTVDENGNTIIKTDNGDGTTTETVIDKDGNVVQTKTYATGDNRMASMTWIYFAIIAVALCLGVVCYRDFRVSDKNRKFVDSHLKS